MAFVQLKTTGLSIFLVAYIKIVYTISGDFTSFFKNLYLSFYLYNRNSLGIIGIKKGGPVDVLIDQSSDITILATITFWKVVTKQLNINDINISSIYRKNGNIYDNVDLNLV